MWQRDRLGTAPAIAAKTGEYFELQDAFGRWIGERCTLDPALSAESPSISPYATAFAGSVDATWTLQSSPPYTVLNLRALVNLPLGWRMYEQFYVRVLGSGGVNAAMAVMQATARAKRSRLSTAAGANLENNWSLAI